MASYKVLKSVAHNIGHSFVSDMNYRGDDYVMGHILRLAKSTGRDTLAIDFIKREGGPPELLAPPISDLPSWETERFWHLVETQGSQRSLVQDATLTLRYEIFAPPQNHHDPQLVEDRYFCDVHITDTRGKDYKAQFIGWWYPGQHRLYKTSVRPWWKFWAPRHHEEKS